MQALIWAEEPNHPRRIIRVLEWKIISCPKRGPSKQARLMNSARSLIERRAEPLGNLNKGLSSAPRVAYPLMRHVHAQEPHSEDNRNDCTKGWPLLGLLTLPTAASERGARNMTCTHEAYFPQPTIFLKFLCLCGGGGGYCTFITIFLK